MERITVEKAASLLGVSKQYVRIGMQRGWLPIGSCVKMSSKWTYHISPYLLEQYVGANKMPPAATGSKTATDEVAERTIL